jgi:hypothetical protein
MTRASITLMRTALEQSYARVGEDAICAQLVPYLDKHIPEERCHDEWLLRDLDALGLNRAEYLKRLPSHTVAALIGAQYYWIFHYHPVALLGYMELAEGYPPTIEHVDELINRTGFPSSAFRALRRHAVLDLQHRDELHDLLDSLPLNAEHLSLIGVSSLQSVHLASQAIREVV